MADRRRVRRLAGRKDSTVAQFLDRVPRDVQDQFGAADHTDPAGRGSDDEKDVTFTLGQFAKFSLGTRDAGTAQIREALHVPTGQDLRRGPPWARPLTKRRSMHGR